MHGTEPGRFISDNRKAPPKFKEAVTDALVELGIERQRAELLVIDNRSYLVLCNADKKTPAKTASEIKELFT